MNYAVFDSSSFSPDMNKAQCTYAALFLSVCLIGVAADERPRGQGGGRGGGPQNAALDDVRFIFKTDVPAHSLDVVLGRPGRDSVTASVLSYKDGEGFIQYGSNRGAVEMRTPSFALKAGDPIEIALSGLQSDAQYYYRLNTRSGGGMWKSESESSFHTQRPAGAPFVFTVQADSHLDYNTDPALYERCLANALADHPDFHIDLGDTFMTDKHRGRETAAAQYVAQRYYFGKIARCAPLFLVLGNHDGEAGRWLDGGANNMAVWSNLQRKRYFPNPIPNNFYSGNNHRDAQAGLLEDYFAWEWGDALFVVLDPFWYTTRQRGGEDNWSRTLGLEQYQWLAKTLEASHAKFRFVFLHHLVGGLGKDARGGAEAAPLYEWGGHDTDGSDVFAVKRPGWLAPIHDLLVKNHVNIVFHGHDHLYVKQELDGVVYQEVPQPGYPRLGNTRSVEEYGYKSGTVLGSSGHLRVNLSSSKVTVEYVQAVTAESETSTHKNGSVATSYEVSPR